MTGQRRKICVITGTRAEFGLLKPVMEKIHASDLLELQVIATGMHLLPEHGSTVSEIESANLPVHSRIPMIVSGDDKPAMTLSIGLGIISFTQVFSRLNPDIVLVLGDRFEIFSAAIAASFSGHVVAHMSGGDTLQAGYDEYVRHSLTKISHIHFPSTKNSAERIMRLGENPDRIFVVGSTALDTILNKKLPSRADLREKYPLLPDHEFALVIQHPISTDHLLAGRQMEITLNAIQESGLRIIVIYPNNDPGGRRIIEVIDQYQEQYPGQILAFKSLPFEDYLGMLGIASVMVGNSSSGIIESSSFHLPVVNIGDRQKGRERADNIIDVPHDKNAIKNAINTALYDETFRNIVFKSKNPYGDGHASERIVDILSRIEITPDIFKKKITY
jgi:UDP-N-acetylglucosamine 2-epimerase (non-hydrolysing)/GDP/UDP-N,N'-diacetylbacillosamine 2-epimerase (hydrolysing)